MIGGRVSHNWCMSVVSHGYGGFGGVRIEVVDGMHAGRRQGAWSPVGRCRSISKLQGEDTGDTRSQGLPGAQLWLGSSRNWSFFLDTGCHEKAPFRCPCSRLATHNATPRTCLV